MEKEVKHCISISKHLNDVNIIVMTTRILIEWCDSNEGYCWSIYPKYELKDVDLLLETNSLKSVIYTDNDHKQIYNTHVSEDYSKYPTFHQVYSVSFGYYSQAKKDILTFYESTDPLKKLVKYEDWNIQFKYLS